MLKDVFHKQVTLTFVTPLQPEKESMLSSWQQDSPLVGDDPEEYCIDNIRVVVLHVNPVRKTWNATLLLLGTDRKRVLMPSYSLCGSAT